MKKKKKTRKQRKQDRKRLRKQSETSSEINKLAWYLARKMSKMTPPYHDKQGDTFIYEGRFGCFPFGSRWYELVYCDECFHNKPPDKPSTRPDVKWVGCMKSGNAKWRLTDVKGKESKDCTLRL